MNRRVGSRRWLLFGVFLCALSWTQVSLGVAQSPSPNPRQQTTRRGFFDYALDKVNPKGNDYGADLERGRDRIVDRTIDDLYFWSNVISLALLIAAVSALLFHWRSADKREVIVSSIIAQLWNGRISDRIEIERRTAEFNRLAEAHNAEIERALMAKTQASESRNAEESVGRGVRKLTEKTGISLSGKDQAQLRLKIDDASASPTTDLTEMQQSHLLLQRRVEALQNSEANLKQRLTQTTVLLDQERRRNTTLKGG